MDIANIPNLPSREQRFEEITVDCYNEYEQLSAFEIYLSDALRTPLPLSGARRGRSRSP
ncbi:MAG: hypothetical protein HC822_03905 [Oscillochloris sp.]|nr:hypothetical protein [Oscillochloris sp.]